MHVRCGTSPILIRAYPSASRVGVPNHLSHYERFRWGPRPSDRSSRPSRLGLGAICRRTEVQRNHAAHRLRRLAPTSVGREPTHQLARPLDEQRPCHLHRSHPSSTNRHRRPGRGNGTSAHADPERGRAVSAGRRSEFAACGWSAAAGPDPQDPATSVRSRLAWRELACASHASLLDWHRRLLRLRRQIPVLADGRIDHVRGRFEEDGHWLVRERGPVTVAYNLAAHAQTVPLAQERSTPIVELRSRRYRQDRALGR